MISTLVTLALSLLGGGGVAALVGLLFRWGLAPAFLTAIPMLVKVADLALDFAIGFFRVLGQAFTIANSNPPVYVLLFVSFLSGGIYFGEGRPFGSKSVKVAERVERNAGSKGWQTPPAIKKNTSALDDFRCAFTGC